MEFTEVSSSNIAGVSYDSNHCLFVKFTNGSVYVYEDVPVSVFSGLLDAESKGKFFAANIKNNYSYRKES